MTLRYYMLPIGPGGARRKVRMPLSLEELLQGELRDLVEDCRDRPDAVDRDLALRALRLRFLAKWGHPMPAAQEGAVTAAAWGANWPSPATLRASAEELLQGLEVRRP